MFSQWNASSLYTYVSVCNKFNFNESFYGNLLMRHKNIVIMVTAFSKFSIS
jgi:hypothetical protein